MDALAVSNALLASMQKDFDSAKPVFPTFLNASIQIKKAIDREDFSLDMLVPLIQVEPMLSSRLIGLANSAFYNRSGNNIKDVKGAVMRLGCSVVRSVAFAVATKQLAEGEEIRIVRDDVAALWKHSMATAFWAQAIAGYSKAYSPDEALFAGMLQNIGKFYVLCKVVHFTRSREVIVECVNQWHAYASALLMDSLGVPVQVKAATIRAYKGAIPPASLSDILQCSTILSEDKNPMPIGDAFVQGMLIEDLRNRFGNSEFARLEDVSNSECARAMSRLFV